MIKNMNKFKKLKEGYIRRISELFQTEITFITCLLLPMSLVILPCRSYIVPNVQGMVS